MNCNNGVPNPKEVTDYLNFREILLKDQSSYLSSFIFHYLFFGISSKKVKFEKTWGYLSDNPWTVEYGLQQGVENKMI